MLKRLLSLLLAAILPLSLIPAGAEGIVSLDSLMQDIESEAGSGKALTVGAVEYEISGDGQSIFISRPAVTGPAEYTIAYNIYDSDSNPVNYFYSLEDRVAATPGYGGLFNVFVVVTDSATGESSTQNIGWHELKWPHADSLTVGRAAYEISPDGMSVFVDRPDIRCRSGHVTVAYNIYDQDSSPVNYFYSTQRRVAATPDYAGTFNVFIVVTDTETGEQDVQNIGWQVLGEPQVPQEEEWPTQIGFVLYDRVGSEVTVTGHPDFSAGWPDPNIRIPATLQGRRVTAVADYAFQGEPLGLGDPNGENYTLQRIFSGELSIPGTMREIGESAFENMWFLTNGGIDGSGLKKIGEAAFRSCHSLSGTLRLGEQCEIGETAFANSLLTVTQTGTDRWYQTVNGVYYRYENGKLTAEGCQRNATQLKLADKVSGVPLSAISGNAFKGCTWLKGALTIPATVTEIGNSAFQGCTGLTTLSMSGTVSLGSRVFDGCTNLKGEITLSDGSSWGPESFMGTRVNVFNADGSSWLVLEDGIYYYFATTTTPSWPPRTVTTLYACGAHPDTKKLNLLPEVRGETVTRVQRSAFSGRSDLTGPVVIPEGYTRIDFAAFAGCSGLTGVPVFPSTLTYIDGDAFRGCSGLSGTLYLPATIHTGIGVFTGTHLTVIREETDEEE